MFNVEEIYKIIDKTLLDLRKNKDVYINKESIEKNISKEKNTKNHIYGFGGGNV